MLKAASLEFAIMRRLAMRFRGIYAMQRIARTLQHDFDAVLAALTTRWSNR